MSAPDDAKIRAQRSRAAQGLPPTITDPAALHRLAVLLSPHADEPEDKP